MKKLCYGMIIFAVYSFLLTMTLQLNDNIVSKNPGQHYAGVFALGLGFLLFYISRVLIKTADKRRFAIFAVGVIYAGCIAARIISSDAGMTSVIISTLTVGYLGGMVYYNLASIYSIAGKSGLVLAVGATAAFFLQYLFQGFISNSAVVYCFLVVGAVIMMMTALFPMGDFSLEQPLPYAQDSSEWTGYIVKSLAIHIVISLCIIAVLGLCEITYILDSDGAVNLYGAVRLFIPVGYFAIGITYDLKEHRASEFLMFGLLAFSLAARNGADFATARVGLFYFLVGASIAYITLGFWNIAPKTNHPDLWAVFGRITSMAESFIIYLLIQVNNKGIFLTEIVTGIFVLAIALLILYESRMKEPEWKARNVALEEASEDENKDSQEKDLYDEETFLAFAANFRLTPRERDVMYCILHSDAKIKSIAMDIGLSDRMVYRYMNQLYEKLETENRAGLMKIYFDFAGKYNR